jgi:eukaryotic-like serine/threonine-protein kinase
MSTNEKLVPGMVLGRYELLLPIAQGGMATVWAARQRGTRGFNKTVAIKTMLPTLTEDPQFEQMFLDEAALAAKIHHPNVAEILDLGEQDEVLYIVMEWVDGEALSIVHKATRKNQAQMPIRLALKIMVQACAGLHAAHELRDENDVPLLLVHRDVSPQNVLVTYDGIVKLVDFGVAKAVGRAGGETSAGQLKGKVPYMSPEQARGGTVDRRTDIFAMGIVLYKLTTGLHPFMGENDLVTMRNIISRPLLPPRVKNPEYPQDVEQILLKCLQKDAEKRYQTVAELGQALERVLAAMGVADDDIGAYVRAMMGDRGAKRRAAVRDAVRIADERYATGTHAAVVLSQQQQQQPVVHEGVSDIVLTKMSSGVNNDLLRDRASTLTPPTSSATPRAKASWGGSDPPPESHATTDQPVMVPASIPGVRRSRSGMLVGVAAAAAAAAMIVGYVVLRPTISAGVNAKGGGERAVAPAASSATPVAAPVTPSATVAAATAAPTPSAAHSVEAVSINTLPDAPDGSNASNASSAQNAQKRRPGASGPLPAPTATAKAADAPTRKVSTDKVPIFTNPGF